MACLHPHSKKVVNPLTGEVRTITYPCGKCINCLHAFQDSWRIRLEATSCAYGAIVFDTLTIRPEAMEYNDVYDDCMSQDYKTLSSISDAAWKLLCKYKWQLPYYPKSELQDWLKRGREAFKRKYGVRCDMKYFIVQEYGPRTSRPHYHCIFWGIGYADYMEFFGNYWRENIGWTKPCYVMCNSKSTHDSFKKIARYVSKYVSKGQFESPLVEAQLMEKPYRLISKGVGGELLNREFFKPFIHPDLEYLTKFTKEKLESYGLNLEDPDFDKIYFDDERAFKTFENLKNGILPTGRKLTDKEINRLAIYYDEAGYAHSMPRYYKEKIGKNHEYNLYTLALSTLLQQSSLVHYNKGLQEEAARLGIVIDDELLTQDSSTWGLSPESLFMVTFNYTITQKSKAYTQAERRYTELKNHYNRLAISENREALL